jgi:hypothetical protein
MCFNISYLSSVFDIFGIVIYLQQIIWAWLSVLGAREKKGAVPLAAPIFACFLLILFCFLVLFLLILFCFLVLFLLILFFGFIFIDFVFWFYFY